MRKQVFLLAIVLLFLSGCGGRQAYPVQTYQYGDEQRSCEGLRVELSQIESDINRLIPEADKTGKNVAIGLAGLLLWPIWFAMDLSEAEQIEINALRKRYNHLVVVAGEKRCGFKIEPLPEIKPPPPSDDDDLEYY